MDDLDNSRFILRTLYPLYSSIVKFNKNDEEDFPRMVKYWSLYMIVVAAEGIIGFVVYE